MNRTQAYNKLLKPFETRPDLQKEWQGDFYATKRHLISALKLEINGRLIYERGAKWDSYKREQWADNEEIENLFGLPYTSSGFYAGMWNTNTQARAKHGAVIYFEGIAQDMQNKVIFIFKNNAQKYYFFNEYEFINYQEEAQRMERAEQYAEYVKEANKLFAISIHILSKYEGRKLGEATRNKINDELRAHCVGCKELKSAYLDRGHITTYSEHCGRELSFWLYELKDNAITLLNNERHYYAECDPFENFFKAKKQRQAIRKTAQELTKQIEEYKKIAEPLHQVGEAIQSVYALKLPYLCDGSF